MKCILVATDGSDGADRAVDVAAQWANTFKVDLLIVNVISGLGLPNEAFKQLTRSQHGWLDEMIQGQSGDILVKARDRARKFDVREILLESRYGDAAQSIIEIAQEKKPEIIVVGKRGTGRLTGILLGSVSQKLVSLAPCTVVVVP
jgi:nucleotide-binding universal stress UspA family protein